MIRRWLKPRRVLFPASVGAIVTLALTTAAAAYFLTTGTGTARSSVGTLGAPSITSTTPGAGTVALSWSTVQAPDTGTVSYYVQRDGGNAGGNCPSSSSPAATTSCVDSGLTAGTYHYTVTAVWRTWSATGPTGTVTLGSAAADHFVVSAATTTPTPGAADNLTITAKDSANNTVTAYIGAHSLTFSGAHTAPDGTHNPTVTNSSGAAVNFGSATPITFSNGVAAVSGSSNGVMTLYKAETASIIVSDGTISNGTGLSVTVTAAAAAKLAFPQQPSGGTSATAFATQPIVAVDDLYGNVLTTNTSSVTLAITSGTGTSGATLSCTTIPLAASAGLASFAGCKIDKAGTGYTLTATDGTLTAATSNTFTITAPPIVLVATGTTATRANSGSLSPAIPTGLSANDLMIAIVANTTGNVSSAPTGWTSAATVGSNSGAGISLSISYRLFQTGVSAPSITVNTDSGGSSAEIVAFRNVNTTTPLDVTSVTSTSAAGSSTFTPTGLTTATANARAESIVAENPGTNTAPTLSFSNAQSFSAETGFPNKPAISGANNSHAVDLAGQPIASPAAVTFPTFTTSAAGIWAGVSLAMRP